MNSNSFYKNIIVLGASIMNASFARQSLTTVDAVATHYAHSIGLTVDVYGYAFSSDRIVNSLPRIAQALAAFPKDDTLFFIHTGGNDVTDTRPYAKATQQALDKFNADLDSLFALLTPRASHCIVSNLTFRSYNADSSDTRIFYDETLGSKPYNDNLYLPRIKRLNPAQLNSDGEPVVDLYNMVRNHYQLWLADGKHMNALGIRGLREYVLDRLLFFVQHQQTKPAPIVPASSPSLSHIISEKFDVTT